MKKIQKVSRTHMHFGVCASVLSILCAMPSFGATNSQITRLLQQKKQKMAQLEQCAQKVKGFKIAGISTLGLTAVGVGGNIALASKNKSLDREIDSTQSQIETEKEKLEKIQADIAAEELKQGSTGTPTTENNNNQNNNGNCTDFVARVNVVKPGCIVDSERQKTFCHAEFISAEQNPQNQEELLVKYRLDKEDYSNSPQRLLCGLKNDVKSTSGACDLSWYDDAVSQCQKCAQKIPEENKQDFCGYSFKEVFSGDEDHQNVAAFFVANAKGEAGSITVDNCVCDNSGKQNSKNPGLEKE